MKTRNLFTSAALISVLAVPAFAQEVTEDRQDLITVTGLRPVQIDDVTASVTVLDADLLSVRGSPYLADQLRAVPGVAVSRSGAVGGLTQVRMRGAEANHTLVLVDGIEVSDPVTGETDFGLWSGLEAQRIEIVRGEQSVLYGSDAIGGVVAVTTGGEGARGLVEIGSRDTRRGVAAYDAAFGQHRLGASLSGFTTEGVDTSGRGAEKDGSEDWSGVLRGGFALGGDWGASALARYGESMTQTDPDLDFDGRLDNADRETESQQSLIGVSLGGSTGPISHAIRANWSEVQRENLADGAYVDDTTGTRTKLSYSPAYAFETGNASHDVAAIIDFESEEYERRSNDVLFGDPNQSQKFETFGVGAEYRFSIAGFAANASVRQDDNDGRFKDATTWRVGAAYAFNFGGKLRASIGEGVKNPTFTELFGYYPATFIGNPDLTPETSQSYEIGWDQTIGPFSASLTYFSAELDDEIYTAFSFDPDTFLYLSTPLNRVGASERDGVELAANWQVNEQFGISAMASKVESTSDSGIDEIRVPEWTASLSADWVSSQREGLRYGVAADYVGEQLDTDFGTYATVTLDEYVLLSASADLPLNERLAFTMRAENLLDEEVTDVFGYYGPGAAFFIGFRLR